MKQDIVCGTWEMQDVELRRGTWQDMEQEVEWNVEHYLRDRCWRRGGSKEQGR